MSGRYDDDLAYEKSDPKRGDYLDDLEDRAEQAEEVC